MRYGHFLLQLLLALVVFASGCAQQPSAQQTAQSAAGACVQACRDALAAGRSLESGPCLLDPVPGTQWVCDVAHEPRQAVDNIAENQCQSFRSSAAKNFVEVTPNCSLIRTG